MAIKNDIKALVQQWKDQSDLIEHNHSLFNIFEGDLLTYVLASLKIQLSPKSYERAKQRVAAINVLRRLVDKLSKIYGKPPVRTIEGGGPGDEKLLKFYEDSMDINTTMTNANRFFNLQKNCVIEPYLDKGMPKLRIIPADRYFVTSHDRINPMRPTHLTKIMGKVKDVTGKETTLFYTYTDDEFLAFDSDEKPVQNVMDELENPEGVNIFGKIPGVYLNRSRFELTPKRDTDILSMTVLIPVLLTDLNYAVMFQSFSITYTIDAQGDNLSRSPEVLWDLKSDPTTDKAPQVGSIKPEVDIDQVMGLIKSQLAFWMQTRNIKPGAMGEITAENAVSGVAKIIDEMDTSEDRQEQVAYFIQGERELWDLIVNHMHPVWMQDPEFEMYGVGFTQGAKVVTTFAEQRPVVDSSKAIADQKGKMDLRLQDRKGALKELYPDWSDEQIAEKLADVDKELTLDMETAQAHMDEMGIDPNAGNPPAGNPKAPVPPKKAVKI